MEKISDFFKDLKDRLSSPLISSFLIAWLISNWRIPIGLIFYKIQDLKVDGYRSYFDLISQNIDLVHNLIWPLSIAFFYTFIFPFIRNIILAFGAWIKRWGNAWNLQISEHGVISVSNYIKLRTQYAQLTKSLIEITNNESKTQQDNGNLNLKIIELSNEKKEIISELNKYAKYNTVESISGKWKFKSFKPDKLDSEPEFILGDMIDIINQKIIIIKNNKEILNLNIINIISNLNYIILLLNDSTGNKFVWEFRNEKSLNFLTGKDLDGTIIQIERIN